VPGCPPRPEALAHGILRLRSMVQGNAPDGWRERYEATGTEELLAGQADPGSADISVLKPGDSAGA
jgi:NADH-quinone oxidoreductase subunit B